MPAPRRILTVAHAPPSAGELTLEAPLRRRLTAWADERFPLGGTALLLFVVYAAALLYGRATAHPGPLSVSLADAGGFLAVWAFFLAIRVLDEHKDYERDAVNHPDRVLQRGLVTLRDLRLVGAVAIAVELAVSLLMDGGIGPVTAFWLAAMAWVALTAKEFFAGEWLNRRPSVYLVPHLPIWSFAVLWMAQMGARPDWLEADAAWLALLGFLLAAAIDLARRSAPAALEGPGATSYSDDLGAGGAVLALGGSLAGGAVVAAVMLHVAGEGSVVADAVLGLALVPVLAALASFRRDPMSRAADRRLKASARLALLSQLAVVAVGLIAGRGLP